MRRFRAGVSRDINRPDFDDLSTSVSFGTGPNTPVPVGNPDLVPESVWSFDASGEYYFAPSSFVALGFFHKTRTNLFSEIRIDLFPARDANGGLAINITPPCDRVASSIRSPIATAQCQHQLRHYRQYQRWYRRDQPHGLGCQPVLRQQQGPAVLPGPHGPSAHCWPKREVLRPARHVSGGFSLRRSRPRPQPSAYLTEQP